MCSCSRYSPRVRWGCPLNVVSEDVSNANWNVVQDDGAAKDMTAVRK